MSGEPHRTGIRPLGHGYSRSSLLARNADGSTTNGNTECRGACTDFYKIGWSSYDEALTRAKLFKQCVEDRDGWKLVNRGDGVFAKETEVRLYFGLAWFGSVFDVTREPSNGRGPVDFKVSIGAADKSLIEFKLASNRHDHMAAAAATRTAGIDLAAGGFEL